MRAPAALRSRSCRATCPAPAPCCSAGRAAGGGGGHGPGRAPLPEGGRGLPPEPRFGAAACRSGGTRSGLGTGPAGRVVGGCCRLGRGCRKTPNSPATTPGRGGRSDGALRIPRPGALGRAVRRRPKAPDGDKTWSRPPSSSFSGSKRNLASAAEQVASRRDTGCGRLLVAGGGAGGARRVPGDRGRAYLSWPSGCCPAARGPGPGAAGGRSGGRRAPPGRWAECKSRGCRWPPAAPCPRRPPRRD